jgi:hypothetical protein
VLRTVTSYATYVGSAGRGSTIRECQYTGIIYLDDGCEAAATEDGRAQQEWSASNNGYEDLTDGDGLIPSEIQICLTGDREYWIENMMYNPLGSTLRQAAQPETGCWPFGIDYDTTESVNAIVGDVLGMLP